MYEIGLCKEELYTPAALIDLHNMEKNIEKMASFFKGKKAELRAHTKVHRLPVIAHKQIRAGAKGICCQKVGSAELMVDSGIRDVLVSSQIVTPSKIKRLVILNKKAKISVPVDSQYNAELISKIAIAEDEKIDVFIDVHLESGRCGVEPGKPALKLGKNIAKLRGLNIIGLMGFEGHISSLEPREKRRREIERLEGKLVKTKKLMEEYGIEIREISTGSTGTYDISGNIPEVTEVQAGSYVLMSPSYHRHVPEFDCALSILTTVISKPSEDRLITDAGRMSNYVLNDLPELVHSNNSLQVTGVHAENTLLKTDKSVKISVGDKIELYPVYLDGTMKIHDKVYGIKNNKVMSVWKTIGRDTSR